MLSARVVDPRTSANSSEHSTSAPPWLRLSIRKQPVQYFGFLTHLAWPTNRMTIPPGPANGAAHSLHRGELGSRACNRRLRRNGAWSTSRRRHFSSDGGGLSVDGAALGGGAALGIARILRSASERPRDLIGQATSHTLSDRGMLLSRRSAASRLAARRRG